MGAPDDEGLRSGAALLLAWGGRRWGVRPGGGWVVLQSDVPTQMLGGGRGGQARSVAACLQPLITSGPLTQHNLPSELGGLGLSG